MKRSAVSVLVTRQSNPREVLLVKRNAQLAFLGDYLAFPGGTLDPQDEQIPVSNSRNDTSFNPKDFQPFLAAAVRELFEETGIWLGRGPATLDDQALRVYRRRMLADEITFAEILKQESQQIDAADFTHVCRIVTPPYSSRRYDAHFLHCQIPADAMVEIWQGELDEGHFVTSHGALRRWRSGEVLIAPPVVTLLQEMSRRKWHDFLTYMRQLTDEYQRGKLQRDYYSCGVIMAPLITHTKPPATHTNFFVAGEDQLYLVDPAPSDSQEQEKLWELLDELLAEGRTFKGILLTHNHPDHVGAVVECRRRYKLPLYAHKLAAQSLPEIDFDGYLEHGQELDLGTAPDGGAAWKLRVYHLPGHAPGHVVFQESRYGALIVGDLVSTLSSILIDPRDGHLSTYMKSLEFLESIAEGVLYPSHGPPARSGRIVVEQALRHRRGREEQLLAALSNEPQTLDVLLERLYAGVDAGVTHLAQRSLRSGLIKLIEEGSVEEMGGGYRLVR